MSGNDAVDNYKELLLANILVTKKHQVKLKPALIVEIGCNALNHPFLKRFR